MLGMANRRDGGYVVVGVNEKKDKTLDPSGLTTEDLATWSYDLFAAIVAPYASPNVSFDVATLVYQRNKFVVIKVHEFEDIPVICARHWEFTTKEKKRDHVLREGALYVRSRARVATVEISTQADMRDLIDLATEKQLRSFLRQAERVGMAPMIGGTRSNEDEAKFKEQLGTL